jgi:hypothetical protein
VYYCMFKINELVFTNDFTVFIFLLGFLIVRKNKSYVTIFILQYFYIIFTLFIFIYSRVLVSKE